jgi:hypothetical protein
LKEAVQNSGVPALKSEQRDIAAANLEPVAAGARSS